jgi:hypothetical protein
MVSFLLESKMEHSVCLILIFSSTSHCQLLLSLRPFWFTSFHLGVWIWDLKKMGVDHYQWIAS